MNAKKRTTNFTPDEKRILSELVLKYKESVENKKTDAATNSQKLNSWIRLAKEFNSISSFCHRSHQSLKICWENLKRQSKKENAYSKKEFFKTGGGLPPPTTPINQIHSIVEAVLGPAVDGLPQYYDSDGIINNIVEVKDTDTVDLSVLSSEYNRQTENTRSAEVICNNDTKENIRPMEQDTPVALDIVYIECPKRSSKGNEEQPGTPSTSRNIDNTKENDMETWTDWTPKTLKRPLTECLRTNEREGKSAKRRRPANENLQDELLKEKISLVQLLKAKAEEEANLKILILKEQLKQEKLKTEKLFEQ